MNGLVPAARYGIPLPADWHLVMTARRTSAAEVLLSLGLQEGTRRTLHLGRTTLDEFDGRSIQAPDGLRGNVEVLTAALLQFESSTRDALRQYLTHLPQGEAAPFLPLLEGGDCPAPDEPADVPAGAAVEPGPAPLDTRTMARALDGIEGQDALRWRRRLGDCPQWAQGARVTPGKRGQAASWDPVKLALLLSESKRATQDRLSKMFRDRPELEHWRDAYRTALGAFTDYGL